MAGFTINTVALSGNLTRDVELRTTGGGTEVCQLRIAVTERFKDRDGEWKDRPNFFDVTVFGGVGGWLAKNVRKGDSIAVQGRLRWREWETQDGGKRQAIEIVADSVVPVPRNGGSGRSSGGNGGQARETAAAAAPADDFSRPLPGADDDIPF